MHVHLIGIGGTGLSAIAKVLLERGFTVTGSDRVYSDLVKAVESVGAQVFIGHNSKNITGADFIVRSSAVPDDNVEVLAAKKAGIPVHKRADFLHNLTKDYKVIAVAGTHGKTTTTSMLAWMLTELHQDPSYIVGGVVNNLGTNAHAGKGTWFVIEADEYDRMFLGLKPDIAIITNIEHDHPDIFPEPTDFELAFRDFTACVKENGVIIGCGDNPPTVRLLEDMAVKNVEILQYGIDPHRNTYWAEDVALKENRTGYEFNFMKKQEYVTHVSLQIPGKHNVANALAALSVIDKMSLSVKKAANILSTFSGAERRFDIRGESKGITIIDDYAHHPTEIKTTIQATKTRYPEHELWVVWQPHTFSRILKFYAQFIDAFQDANHLVITNVYAAREKRPRGFSIAKFVDDINHLDKRYIPEFSEVIEYLLARMQPRDIVLVLSAGDAVRMSEKLYETLRDEQGDISSS